MRVSFRPVLLLLLAFSFMACSSAPPACDCAASISLPSMPGSADFVEARTKLVACFLRARAQTLSGKPASCDATLQSTIAHDLGTLNTTRQELQTLLEPMHSQSGSVALLRANLAEIERAIAIESSYAEPPAAPAPAVAQAAAPDCPNTPLFKLEVELALPPEVDWNDADSHERDSQRTEPFVERRGELANCVRSLRREALEALASKQEDADALLAATTKAEGALVADTKRLLLQREQLLADLGKRSVRDEHIVVNQLHDVKHALEALAPYVTIAGNDVSILDTEFAVARKKHDDNDTDAKQQKKCMDRFAYLDVAVGDDAKELMDCVERVRKVCRADSPPANCEDNLNRLEDKLREYAGDQYIALNKLKTAHDSASDQKKNDDERAAISKRLDSIRDMEIIPDEGDILEYSDYRRWWSKFSAGYEYLSLNDAFSKGFLRTGAMIGLNIPGQQVPDSPNRNAHLWRYGVFSAFSIGLTNTAEQTKTNIPLPGTSTPSARATDDPMTPTPTPTPAKVEPKNVLAIEEQLFWPWWRSDLHPSDRRMRTWIGPIFTAGGRKTDDANEPFLATRFYEGFRFAHGPEMYSDFMIGKSAGLRSRRAEVRGQIPLPHRFDNGARVVIGGIGGIGNFGIDQRKHAGACTDSKKGRTCPELDTIRFYLSYDMAWSDLLKGFTGAK